MTFTPGKLVVIAWAFLTALPALAVAPPSAPTRLTKEGLDYFEAKIRPLLLRKCYECHSGDPAKAKGGLTLDTREGLRKGGQSGAAIVPGAPDDSLLIEAVRYEGLEMPPKGPLSDEEIADLVKWIAMGAPDPRVPKSKVEKLDLVEARKFWAFQRPKASLGPTVKDASWPQTDIDRFVLARLEIAKLKPVVDADRVTLIRRATFDVTGLPPTPEEIDAFVKDSSPKAFATVVDRLLASPQFGERWGRHWLDVARYGESTGKERNIPYRYAWRYRDYVIDSFNADKPYDRFVSEQLAGDLLPAKNDAERNALLIATGFLAIGTQGVNQKNPEQFLMDIVDDQIDVTTRGLLGLTVSCARCHDHKFDPIPTTDYYGLAGVFHSTKTYSGVARGKRGNNDGQLLGLVATTPNSKVTSAAGKAEAARVAEVAQIQTQLEELRNQLRTMRKSMQSGKGMATQGKPRQLRQQIEQLQERLTKLGETSAPETSGQVMGVMDSSKPANCQVLVRGEVDEKGPEVPRGGMAVLNLPPLIRVNSAQSGRAELARWIASPDNPLTARVMVNRVWQHLFGSGLVETVDNFGHLGDTPSHPELLDTLAVQFVKEKWSVKRLIRSIMLSRVYQLGSQQDAHNDEVDPADRLLWRMQRRRLDAEEIRDAMLAASGQLNPARPNGSAAMELGGSEIKRGKEAIVLQKPSTSRSVYLPMVRGLVPEALAIFDMADPSLIVGKREVTTVATQALFLMNNAFVLEQSEQMARRVLARTDLNESSRVTLAYRLALGRLPTSEERSHVDQYLKAYQRSLDSDAQDKSELAAWSSYCQALFACAEFRYLY